MKMFYIIVQHKTVSLAFKRKHGNVIYCKLYLGTPKIVNFPFETNGKLIIFRGPKMINFPSIPNGKLF